MKKIIQISLILLILIQSVGVTFSRHYCGSMPADWAISLTGEKADCGMHQPKPKAHCELMAAMESEPMGCCDTEVEHIQLKDDITQPLQATFDLLPVLLAVISFTFFNLAKVLFTKRTVKGPFPPLLYRKRLLQHLSFLQVFRN